MPRIAKPLETQDGDNIADALLRMAQTVESSTDLDTLLPEVAELTANALCCNGCLLMSWDEAGQRFVPVEACGVAPELEGALFEPPFAPADHPVLREIARGRGPVFADIDDLTEPEPLRSSSPSVLTTARDQAQKTLLGMPLIHRDRVLGGMLVFVEKECLGQREVAFVTAIAQQTALAIASESAHEEELRRRRDLETLQETIALFTAELELGTLYQHVVERAARTFGADAASLFLWDENRESLPPAATFGLSDSYRHEVCLSAQTVHDLLQTFGDLRPFVIADLKMTALISPDIIARERLHAALVIPLQRSSRLMGLIKVYQRTETTSFDEDTLALAQVLAHQAVTALDNAQLYTALRTERERLRALSARLTQAQEAERTRVARELHDEAGQALTAVRLQLDFLASALPQDLPQHLRKQVEEAQLLVGRTLEEIRRISIDLRPSLLDDLGLTPALRWQCERQNRHGQLTVHFLSKQATRRLEPHIETAVYRAAQEALTNIARHAQAGSIDVILDYRENRLHLTITDDGKGFPYSTDQMPGLGLMGMQERLSAVGGSLHIDSQSNIGTTLFIEVPL